MKPKLQHGLFGLVMLALTACESHVAEGGLQHQPTPRNVIFMLGDGMGFAQVKAYRMYADDPATELVEPLPMDAYQVGSVATDSIRMNCGEHGDDRCVRDPHGFTDSASSATAYATGQDTLVGRLSMDLQGGTVATVLEAARKQGKSTGMAVTSELTHASPAAFGAHVAHRDQAADIADQYFDNQWNGQPMVDVLLGGGLSDMRRSDRDLLTEFSQAGYEVALDRAALLAATGDRLLGVFAPDGLPRAWDRDTDTPSLAEMTRTALETLNRNPEGFFLFVEGSQIDWASHNNSVPGVVSEMEDFTAAIAIALKFASEHGDTLVVITADHETGGMSLGRDDIYRWNPQPLKGMDRATASMRNRYLAGEGPLSAIVAPHVPFELTTEEIAILDAAPRTEDGADNALAEVFNRRTLTGWSSPGHTGVDVPLYAFGPGSEHFRGVMQNEEIGRVLWDVFLPGH